VLRQDVDDLAVHFAGRARYLDAVLGHVLQHLGNGSVGFIDGA
jgi:hypothetical protein